MTVGLNWWDGWIGMDYYVAIVVVVDVICQFPFSLRWNFLYRAGGSNNFIYAIYLGLL